MDKIAVQAGKCLHHLGRLDSFDNNLHFHVLEHFHRILKEKPHLRVALLVHKGFIELHKLERKGDQALHIGVAGSVIIQREREACGRELGQVVRHCFLAVGNGSLSDLEIDMVGIHLIFLYRGKDFIRKIGAHALCHGEIDLNIIEPKLPVFVACDKAADLVKDQFPDLVDGTVFLGSDNDELRRDKAMGFVKQTQKGFGGSKLFLPDRVDRLVIYLEFVVGDRVGNDGIYIGLDVGFVRVVRGGSRKVMIRAVEFFVEIISERHKGRKAFDFFWASGKDDTRKQTDVDALEMEPFGESIKYLLRRGLGGQPVLLGKYHPETAAVKIIQHGMAAELFVDFAQLPGNHQKHSFRCLIAEHCPHGQVIADIEHHDMDMLAVDERTFHIISVGAVFVEAGKSINIIFRALYTDAYDKE